MMRRITPENYARGPIVSRVVLRDPDLSARAKVIYAHLSDLATLFKKVYPSQETLAEDLGLSLRSAQRAVSELRNKALVVVTRESRNDPNVYQIFDPGLPDEARTATRAADVAGPDTPHGRVRRTTTEEVKKNPTSPTGSVKKTSSRKKVPQAVAAHMVQLFCTASGGSYNMTKSDRGQVPNLWEEALSISKDEDEALTKLETALEEAGRRREREKFWGDHWSFKFVASQFSGLVNANGDGGEYDWERSESEAATQELERALIRIGYSGRDAEDSIRRWGLWYNPAGTNTARGYAKAINADWRAWQGIHEGRGKAAVEEELRVLPHLPGVLG
jgi:hypothetical protein